MEHAATDQITDTVAAAWRGRLGRVGIWLPSLTAAGRSPAATATAVEALGYGALWVGGGAVAPDAFDQLGEAVRATTSLVVATGIANVWSRPAGELAAAAEGVARLRPGGFLLGLGISHQPLVERLGQVYERPYAHMVRYLDELDDELDDQDGAPGGAEPVARVLAALGPRMLRLAGDRTLGAHPYFVPAAHTRLAREILGAGPLLAPEVAVVVDADPASARAVGRRYAERYLQLPNYTENLRRLGYDDQDLDGGGSDRLVDEVVPWGDEAAVARAVHAHLEAGADHVAVQPVTAEGPSLEVARRLAPVLAAG